jgi:16S rRNA (adenine1518-N6/adenine1519-N6)-dimethyltransferase
LFPRDPSSRRRKALGQNFLRNLAAADRIVERFAPGDGEPVLEVGPGHGVLTERLLAHGARVVAVEKDEALAERLRGRLGGSALLHLEVGDARRVPLEDLLRPHLEESGHARARVLANLPYAAATHILTRLLQTPDLFSSITVMLQKEVADRVCSPPGGRTYGSLSVLAQYFTTPRCLMTLDPGSFTPPPKVRSAVVEMPVREGRELEAAAEMQYPAFIRGLFRSRRRMLKHNLDASWGEETRTVAARLSALGIDPARRPETLTREECLRLFLSAPRPD